MSGLSTFGAPGRYVQGRNATAHMGEQCQRLGLDGPMLLVAGKTAAEQLGPVWAETLPPAGYQYSLVLLASGECTEGEVEAVAQEARRAGARTLVGAGGGKVLDAARAAGDALRLPVVCCPTAASSDAPCSALSVLYNEAGVFQRLLFCRRHPALVLVDTSVIVRSPRRLLVAGLGDALATYFESRACSEACNATILGGTATLAGVALAKLCYETLVADAPAALAAVEAGAVTPAFERVVEANTLLSGLGFESGGLAVAHALHAGLTLAPRAHEFLHGEKVAFGTLAQLVLEGRPAHELTEVYRFCCSVGLPVTLRQVGVDKGDARLLLAIAERAAAPGSHAHNEPFPVTPAALRDAMLAADALGRRHLAAGARAGAAGGAGSAGRAL